MNASRWVALVGLACAAALGAWLLPGLLAALVAATGVLLAAALVLRAPRTLSARPPPAAAFEPRDDIRRALTPVIEPLAEAVLLLDGDLTVVAANPAAAELAGRSVEAIHGVSLIRAVRDHDLVQVARTADGERHELRFPGGREVVATARRSAALPAGHTLVVVEDVTALDLARRARSELVENLSHELRTPIAASRALAETLQSGVDDAATRGRFFDRLVDELTRLGGMVERSLRLARLEAGAETFASERLEPVALLQSAEARLASLAAARNVRIAVEAAPDLPAVTGDAERVLEVLTNLLDNAVRHSSEGGLVTLVAHAEADAVRFEVADQGPGIPPADRQRIFERFYTGDRARGLEAGTGLGLAIARHIVERLGGSIWVADRHPGTTLCFTLPLASPLLDSSADGGNRP